MISLFFLKHWSGRRGGRNWKEWLCSEYFLKISKSEKDHLILGSKRCFRKKTNPKIVYTNYIYPLTLKKARQSFMFCAENKGKLKFCVLLLVKEIFFGVIASANSFFGGWMSTWITTILSPKTTPLKKRCYFKNNIFITSAYLQNQEI